MSLAEDPYGMSKRLEFCSRIIVSFRPRFVIDVGCGTGEHLTRPLANRFPEARFLGVDSDLESIRYARAGAIPSNLSFGAYKELSQVRNASLIIVSEVIEHVESPEQFLADISSSLLLDGRIVLTTPNGYGPFEVASLVQTLLTLSGIFALLRKAKRSLFGGAPPRSPDTLAVSPHVNFFTYGQILNVFATAGFEVERYQARTLLCGFGLDVLVRGLALEHWNARVADRLPPQFVSDWMFLLKRSVPRKVDLYRRGIVTRWRRSLNERQSKAGRHNGAHR